MLALAVAFAPGCLVVSVHPTQERESLVFDPALLGVWQDADDNASLRIERGEWQSYRVRYELPIESGEVTGHLTTIGKARYLDLMPAKGEDHGGFLVPVHVTVRVDLDKDRLILTGLSYDWFLEQLRKKGVAGLSVVLDDKENALIVSPTSAVRGWLARQQPDGLMFGASATFTRKPGG